jgi:hypothetical protein
MSILTEDGIYNDTYIDCTIVKDNIISLLIHDKKNGVTRSYKFESVEKAEELANKLLQVIFDATEVKENTQDNHQKMWKYIWKCLGNGEPKNGDFWRFCERLTFNRFECNNGDLHLTSNAMNTNVIGNVMKCIFDVTKNYDTGGHPVMKIIIHDNPHGKEYHFKFDGEKQVFDL